MIYKISCSAEFLKMNCAYNKNYFSIMNFSQADFETKNITFCLKKKPQKTTEFAAIQMFTLVRKIS